jgi:hypothetical protein
MLFAIDTSRKERRPGSGGANRLSAETIRERRPDFYIPTENTLVEVKSPSTMGITAFCPDRRLTPTGTFEQVRCKALAAIRDGFKFRLFIVSRGKNPIELPETWIQLFDEPDKLKTFLVNFT